MQQTCQLAGGTGRGDGQGGRLASKMEPSLRGGPSAEGKAGACKKQRCGPEGLLEKQC